MNIPSFDLGGDGAPLHFLHANGYPPDCYKPLFEHLQPRFRVFGMKLRPLWPNTDPNEIKDWMPFTEDMLRFLEEQKTRPVLGVGHSIGAIVTLRAVLREPERFSGLVLIDPVLFPPRRILEWNLARIAQVGYRAHPLIMGALRRRRQFNDLDQVFEAYRRREVFRNFSDESLRAYIAGIVQPDGDDNWKLVYSPEWEARIYYTGIWRDWDLWRKLKDLQVPAMIIRGAQSDTFWAETAARVRRTNPKVRVEAIENAGHLVPLEHPQEVAELILNFSKSL